MANIYNIQYIQYIYNIYTIYKNANINIWQAHSGLNSSKQNSQFLSLQLLLASNPLFAIEFGRYTYGEHSLLLALISLLQLLLFVSTLPPAKLEGLPKIVMLDLQTMLQLLWLLFAAFDGLLWFLFGLAFLVFPI